MAASTVNVNENSPKKAEKIPHHLQTKKRDTGRGYAAGMNLWITPQGQGYHKLNTCLDNTACCPHTHNLCCCIRF